MLTDVLLGKSKGTTLVGSVLGLLVTFNGGTVPTLRDALLGVAIVFLSRFVKEPAPTEGEEL